MSSPYWSTANRSQRSMIRRITCSTIRIVTPSARIRRSSFAMSPSSLGVRPAANSSSRTSFGLLARARARSRRFSCEALRWFASVSRRRGNSTYSSI